MPNHGNHDDFDDKPWKCWTMEYPGRDWIWGDGGLGTRWQMGVDRTPRRVTAETIPRRKKRPQRWQEQSEAEVHKNQSPRFAFRPNPNPTGRLMAGPNRLPISTDSEPEPDLDYSATPTTTTSTDTDQFQDQVQTRNRNRNQIYLFIFMFSPWQFSHLCPAQHISWQPHQVVGFFSPLPDWDFKDLLAEWWGDAKGSRSG